MAIEISSAFKHPESQLFLEVDHSRDYPEHLCWNYSSHAEAAPVDSSGVLASDCDTIIEFIKFLPFQMRAGQGGISKDNFTPIMRHGTCVLSVKVDSEEEELWETIDWCDGDLIQMIDSFAPDGLTTVSQQAGIACPGTAPPNAPSNTNVSYDTRWLQFQALHNGASVDLAECEQ